jgi:hypothetical protein
MNKNQTTVIKIKPQWTKTIKGEKRHTSLSLLFLSLVCWSIVKATRPTTKTHRYEWVITSSLYEFVLKFKIQRKKKKEKERKEKGEISIKKKMISLFVSLFLLNHNLWYLEKRSWDQQHLGRTPNIDSHKNQICYIKI